MASNPLSDKPISLEIDHVTIAGQSLEAMQAAFAALELETDYGGPHSNGVTHMALLGFIDGSYIELISSLQPGRKDEAFWGDFIAADGGPCAWAVYVSDVWEEARRMEALGVTVDGPHYYQRRRPDGKLVEWDLAFLGDKGAGATIPFIIKDITPRHVRAQPSASVSVGSTGPPLLTGLKKVVLGVRELEGNIALFQRLYHWTEPKVADLEPFGARVANFSDTSVMLATPSGPESWLAERLDKFDDAPCAYLIGTTDFEAAQQRYVLSAASDWFGRRVAWLDVTAPPGTRLGIIDDR